MEQLMIIGGTGSLGHSLVRRLALLYRIIIVSRDENKQWAMKKRYPNLTYIICDIRDKTRFTDILFRVKPNKIIIAAALKHIDICERNINDCIATNITGIQNILDVISDNAQKNLISWLNTVLFISTDKATAPANVYGMCKAICERMIAEKSLYLENTRLLAVSYGNVLSSRGSLFPLFHEIGNDEKQTYFPVTNEHMTRFFMHLDESIDLILKAVENGKSGDIFIPKVRSYKIMDVATRFSIKYNKPVKIVGTRPGEKLHECLVSESEKNRTLKIGDMYVIKDCYQIVTPCIDFEGEYTSDLSVSSDMSEIDILIDLTK